MKDSTWGPKTKLKKPVFFCLWLLLLAGVLPVSAQDNADFVQFFVNSASLNPSYVGMDAQPALYVGYRRQWAGVTGGPSLGQVSIQAPLKKGLLGGVTATNNSKGLLNSTSLMATGGYQLKLSEEYMLRFGMSLGGAFNRFDQGGIEVADPNDPMVVSGTLNNFSVQGNAGVSIHNKTFHGGISVPQFFQPAYIASGGLDASQLKPFQTVVLHVSNRFYYNRNKNVFEPYLIYRINGAQPSQLEIAGVVHLQNQLWAGASFRQGLGFSGLAGIKLNKLSALGYSYTAKLSNESQLPRPSHEFHLALLFGKRDRNFVGVYSFVNTEKEKKHKSAAQLAAERKKREEALAKKYQNQALHEEPLHKVEEKPVEPKKEEVVVAKPKADSVVKETPKPAVERHEYVKRGNNRNELSAGHYVIVGAFRSETNAKRFSSDLQDMDIPEADFGFITSRGLWYVYVATAEDLEVTKTERDHYRQEKMFRDAWLLTVQ